MPVKFNNRASAENLVDAMSHLIPGDRQNVREVTYELLLRILKDKAYERLSQKYRLKSHMQIDGLLHDIVALEDAWKEEGVRKAAADKKARAEAAKKAKEDKKKAEAKALEEDEEKEAA